VQVVSRYAVCEEGERRRIYAVESLESRSIAGGRFTERFRAGVRAIPSASGQSLVTAGVGGFERCC
jgi:hypothetical protein